MRAPLYAVLAAVPLLVSPVLAQDAGEKAEEKWDVVNAPGPTHRVEISVDEGTWMSVDVSPDGSTIAFDLLGDLYTMPVGGGEATVISTGPAWDMQPRFSPSGERIAFTSDRGGGDNVWTVRTDGSEPVQVTDESFRLLNGPVWTPDGRFIVARKHFTSRRSLGAGEMWMYHASGGTSGLQLTDRPTEQKDVNEPALSPDGRYLYYSLDATPGSTFQYNKDSNGQIYAIDRLDLEEGETVRVTGGPGGACRPTPSPDGGSLAFVRRIRDQSMLFVRDLESGRERPVYESLDRDNQEAWAIHGVSPAMAWTPDSESIVFWAGGKIRRVDVESGRSEVIPFTATATHTIQDTQRVDVEVAPETNRTKMLRWVEVSPDESKVAYQALGKVYVKDLPDGEPRRLTDQDERFEFYPSWAPDGGSIVFTTWNDEGFGAVRTADVAAGRERVVTERPGHYVEPRFSPDGGTIVFRRVEGGYLRDSAWSGEPGIYTVPAGGGEAAKLTGHGGAPFFSPRGDRVLFFHVVPEAHQDRRMLKSVDLSGEDERTHLVSTEATEFILSPDAEWVAFREGFAVYLAPFALTGREVSIGPDAGNAPVRKVSKHAGEYLHWGADGDTLYWSLGSELYSTDLSDAFAFVDGAPEELPDAPEAGVEIGFDYEQDVPEGAIAIVGAKVVTMRGDEVIEDGVVVVEGNRIAAVGPRSEIDVPADAHVVDASGKVVMPGIVDVHAHGAMGTNGIVPERNWINYANLAFGVTTVHDPSNDTGTFFATAELARRGDVLAPRLFGTGRIIYGAKMAGYYSGVETYEDALFHVRRTKAAGATAIKSYNQPRRDQRQMLVQACRELGMNNVPEGGSTFMHNMTMLLDGHTDIEHNLPVAKAYDDVIRLWTATDAGNTPTLVVCFGGLSGERYWYNHTDVHANQRLLNFVPRFVVDPLARRREKAPESEYNHVDAARVLKDLLDAGVPVNVGAHGQMAGLAAHWEMWMFEQGGMTNHEVLRCATLNGAKNVGMDGDIGSLEPGKLADLIVLDEDPLENIRSTESVRYTMLNGRLYDAMTMDQVAPDRDTSASRFFDARRERGWGWNYQGPARSIEHGTCRGCGHPGMSTHLGEPAAR